MIFYDVVQGSEEWHKVRALKLTASKAQAIASQGKGLETLVNELVLRQFIDQDRYVSPDMERGNELEPIARAVYEFETGKEVEEVGFIEYYKYSGCSPDGLVTDKDGSLGGLEIKARNDAKHLALLRGGPIETATVWQIQMCMLITGRKWWDFMSYNPNFKQSSVIREIKQDSAATEKITEGIVKGTKMIVELLNDPVIKKELNLLI